MCPMLLNSLSDGPAMVLSAPQDHAFAQFPRQAKFSTNAETRAAFFNHHHNHSNGFNAYQPPSKPSRKRSRDDAAFEEAINGGNSTPVSAPAPASKPARAVPEQPIYGEGMVLLNPRTKMAVSADSQTGTWYEETAENAATAAATTAHSQQPSLSGRKSQRLDPTAPSIDDIALSSLQSRLSADNTRRLLNTGTRPEEPTVDDATRLLGISWQQMSADSDIAAAVRGWKKYIDRQFASYLSDCEILMKNRALNAYLVTAKPVTPVGMAQAQNAFYLFNDDLTQAQLVGSSWEACLMNLRASPIVFEGAQILNAADGVTKGTTVMGVPMGTQNLLGANPVDSGLPLLQTLSAAPPPPDYLGLNTVHSSVASMGTGMEIDA
ncbi:hypothetical protein BO70DRAFT_135122 [Aspergillus heteromorphus CBS 117.55]|uniref:Uncharacterized protein n=1 Tax=Aspergillus heteromorphus CBS 117.55 TaxID=1448321 RepID=A0A317WY16_9EURO|nr:uncharacterized protein BO70DRAFT_135122 [Aspergillus heteromorphus CBS 117.55]PWY90147.1 hypothetical protein BO70DRAFT_135122 [Aspergillus heteromorphus CBS 117.55]